MNIKKEQNIKNKIASIFKDDNKVFIDGDISWTHLIDFARKLDEDIINKLLQDSETKNHFFKNISGNYNFLFDKFERFINSELLDNSYTSFKNRIGLTVDNRYIKDSKDIVLNFPFKDCYLSGGQTKDEGEEEYFYIDKSGLKSKKRKRKEIFFNEYIAYDEIDALLNKKAFCNFKKYTKKGIEEVKSFNRDENGVIKDNLIIKGNNLLTLHSLYSEFKGKVKLIYIDPPYNTGNDTFSYNDNFNHSSWLVFMKDRLEIAKELLKEDGVIFIQCDDNEQAYLKVLMDEIFNRDNFINCISIKLKNIAGASGGGEDKRFKKNVEYILIYAKNYGIFKQFKSVFDLKELFSHIQFCKENDISWKYTSALINSGDKKLIATALDGDGNEIKIFERINYQIKSIVQISKEQKLNEKEIYYKYIGNIFSTTIPQSSIRVRVLEKLKEVNFSPYLISIQYTPKSGKNKGAIYEQFYSGEKLRLFAWLKDVVEVTNKKIYKKELTGTLWDFTFAMNNLTKEGDIQFENAKKPEALLQRILELSTNEGDLILDFFAGSGTTLSVAHKMKRQYIGVEQIERHFDICIERIKKVIEGEQGGISKKLDWTGGGEFISFELAQHNETAKEKIINAKNYEEIKNYFAQICDKFFLRYNLNIKEFEEKIIESEEFKNLDLEKQKEIFIKLLDPNQMYINYSNMEDKKYKLNKKDIELTREFYKND